MDTDKREWLTKQSKGHTIKLFDCICEIINVCNRKGELNLVVEDQYEALAFIPFSKICDFEILD